jgi:hypothetical protein
LALGAIPLVKGQTVESTTAQPQANSAVALAQLEADSTSRRLSSPEREIDRQHLQRIYKAISTYYHDHQDLPNWLSDLVPQYLSDPKDLISPVETRTGKSVLFGRDDPALHTSYIYEFNAGPAPEEFNKERSVPLTCKQWKLMQLKRFGLVTPMLRCHLHNPVLNVSYAGEVYETGLLWENDPRTAALIRNNPQLGPQAVDSPGTRAIVRVVDAKTGDPIGAATVRSALGSEFGLLPPAEGTADSSGNVSVPLGEWKINFLILTAVHPLYQSSRFEWKRDRTKDEEIPSQLVLKLARKGEAGQ